MSWELKQEQLAMKTSSKHAISRYIPVYSYVSIFELIWLINFTSFLRKEIQKLTKYRKHLQMRANVFAQQSNVLYLSPTFRPHPC